jgi:hypothetical protein
MSHKEISVEELTFKIKNFIQYLLNYKMIWIIIVTLGFILGFCYAYFSKIKYDAKISFIINETKSSSQNPLAAIASQFGSATSNVNVSDDRILFLISTKRILGQSLLARMDTKKCTIADQMIEDWELKDDWKKDTCLINFTQFKNFSLDQLNYYENKVIDLLIKKIMLSKDLEFETVKKKSTSFVTQSSSGIVLLSYKSKDEILAKSFVEAIYNNLSSFYIETIVKSLKYNLDLVSKRADSIKIVMNDNDFETADALDASIGVFKFKGKVKQARLRKDNELLSLMYAEVIKNKEIAKFNFDQEKPVFQLIDEPTLPLEQIVKSKIVFTFIGGILMGFLLLIALIIIYLKKPIIVSK